MSGAAAHPIEAARLGGLAARLPSWSLVTGLVISVLAVGLAIGIPLGDDTVLSRIAVVSFVVGATALAASGVALLQQDGAHPMGWWLVAAGLTGLISHLVIGAIVGGVQRGIELPIELVWSSNWVWIPAQFALLQLLLRFPTGRLPSRPWRAVEALLAGWSVWAIAVTALLPGPLGSEQLTHLDNPFGWAAASEFLNAALTPTFLAIPVLTVLCASAMLWRWFRSSAVERQQLKWILAAVVFLAVVTPFAGLGDVLQLAEAAAYLLLPAALAVAVLQDGLWDLGRVVRRSLIYAGATAVLAGCYLIVVMVIDGATTPIIAALVVAALALPVKNIFQWMLERILFGQRGDPVRAVARLSQSLHRESPSLSQAVVTQLAESLRLPFVALEDADGVQLATAGTPGVEAARLPLTVSGVQTGWLVAHERAPGEGLEAKDQRLLGMVATQAGLAVRAESLAAELRNAFARLATVREEERARLQRDLHDELGPSLAGIVMQSEAARNLAASSSAKSGHLDSVLEGIGTRAEALVQDVRRIIDGLRPASLHSSGLGAAIKEAAGPVASGLHLYIDVPDELPGLEPRAEVTVFRVAVEAVLNAARHAQADTVRVRIWYQDGAVMVKVEDDGRGFRDASRHPVDEGAGGGDGRRIHDGRRAGRTRHGGLCPDSDGGVGMIRVIMADDHPVFLDGLALLLETTDGIEVIGTAKDGRELVALAERVKFDVAIVDLDMPELDGAGASAQLLANRPQAAVLILTMHDDDASLLRALRSGASGYILKGAGHGAIVRAIQGVAAGDAVFAGRAGQTVREVMKTPSAISPYGVTPRELELLSKIASGADNAAIASAMFLSTKTVQNTVSVLMGKLGATSRAHLVALARDLGITG